MPTSTTVKGLNINELTEAQYDAAVQGGVIGPNELSVLTDVPYVEPSDLATVATTGDYDDLINKPTIPAAIQVSSMPTAGADELGKIYQFIGTTDATYTNGYFYKCVSDGQTPATYSWEQTDVQPTGSSLPDQTGQSGKFLTTDGSSASWGTVSTLPDQTGKSGEFLTTDGSSASWTNWQNRPFTNTATKYDCIGIKTAATITGGGEHNILIGSGINASPRSGRVGNGYAVAIGGNPGSVTVGAHGVAIGSQANFNGGTLTGYDLDYCVAVGFNSYTRDQYSTAIGASAGAKGFGSIQLGYGENTNARTLSVGFITSFSPWAAVNYELLSADGTIPEARLADTTNAAQGQVLALDSNLDAVWTTPSGGGLPSQTGNAGKFLTTDGTDASWSDKPLVNKATGTDSLTILGYGTSDSYSIGIGAQSQASGNLGVSIGYSARNFGSDTGRIAIGSNTYNSGGPYSIAIGYYARTGAANAIQLNVSGTSQTNSDANTFKVANANGNFEMMSADGTIPTTRLTKVNSTITLAAADWSGGSQTVTVNGVTSTSVVLVAPDPSDTADYVAAGILCTAQGADSLTFTATTTPSTDIDVVVVAM